MLGRMLQLVVHLPDGQITRRALDAPELVVGRDPSCDVHLPDPKVSRRHARLVGRGDTWSIEDLGSVNGYLLDGAICHDRQPLRAGQQITIGSCTLALEDDARRAGSPRAGASGPGSSQGGAKAPLYRLEVTGGQLVGELFALRAGEHVIGRASDADVILDDPSVSRRHAAVRVTSEGLVELSDLGSSNGTFVEGEQVVRKAVHPGQSLRIGHVPMALVRMGEQRAASARRHELSAGSRQAAEQVRAGLPPLRDDDPALAEAARQAHLAVEAAGQAGERVEATDRGASKAPSRWAQLRRRGTKAAAALAQAGRGRRARRIAGAAAVLLVLGLGARAYVAGDAAEPTAKKAGRSTSFHLPGRGLRSRLTAALAPSSAAERAWRAALGEALRHGEAQLAEDDWEGAATAFGKALELEPIDERALRGRRQAAIGQLATDSVRLGQAELTAQRPFEALVAVAGPLAQLAQDDPNAPQLGLGSAKVGLEQVATQALQALALRHGERARTACAQGSFAGCVSSASCALAFDGAGEVGPALLAWVADVVGGQAPDVPNNAQGAPSAKASLASIAARYPAPALRRAMLTYATGDFAPAQKALRNLGSRQGLALQADVAAVADGAARGSGAEAAGDANAALAAYGQALAIEHRLLPREAASVPRQDLAHRTQRILLARGQQARAHDDDGEARRIWQQAQALDPSYAPLQQVLQQLQLEAQKLFGHARGQKDVASAEQHEARCKRLAKVVAMTSEDDPLHAQAVEASSDCTPGHKRKGRRAAKAEPHDEGA